MKNKIINVTFVLAFYYKIVEKLQDLLNLNDGKTKNEEMLMISLMNSRLIIFSIQPSLFSSFSDLGMPIYSTLLQL